MHLEDLILRLGLVAVFVLAAVEGDVTLILTGVLARVGLLNLPVAIGVGALGGFVGDTTCYGLGRHRSVAIRQSSLYKRAAPTIDRFAKRFGPWQILVARFLYGTRVATMFFWGVRGLSFWRFVGIDLLSCILWATALGGAGFLLSGSASLLIGSMKRVQIGLLVVGVVAVLLLLSFRYRRHRRGSRQE